MLPAEIIKKKRNGGSLSHNEISDFIMGYTRGEIPDYQMSALLMAIYFKGMSRTETVDLTKVMLNSGIVVDTSLLNGFKVDKHSTGGVGDKTSLILGPVVAAAGVYVPMISGRGLGHTGGTLDKLESIPGFNTQQTLEKFIEITKQVGTCFIGQTKDICPADKKIYALRDVTATVESLPLICASIMSKKLAEGIDGLVLDVKFGSGAFMKNFDDAKKLALALMEIAKDNNKKVVSLLTNMNQPLGAFAGNSFEVFECLEIMKNKKNLDRHGNDRYADTRDLSLQLSAHMIHLAGKTKTIADAYNLALEKLENGEALKVFETMCEKQSGRLSELKVKQKEFAVVSNNSGFISQMNVENIGWALIELKGGRRVSSDVVNPLTAIEFHCKIGDSIRAGESVFTIHCDNDEWAEKAHERLAKSFEISSNKLDTPKLIQEVVF